jgi:hypothetical protein
MKNCGWIPERDLINVRCLNFQSQPIKPLVLSRLVFPSDENWELTIDHCSGFLECPGDSAYNFELRTGGPIKQSSQNLRRLRCLALLFAAGCIATESPAQTVRVQRLRPRR